MEEQLPLDLTLLGSPAGLPGLGVFPGVTKLQEALVSRLCQCIVKVALLGEGDLACLKRSCRHSAAGGHARLLFIGLFPFWGWGSWSLFSLTGKRGAPHKGTASF